MAENRKKKNRLLRKAALLIAGTFLLATTGRTNAASVDWHTYSTDEIPRDAGFVVSEFTGKVTVTFLGDCTLGGEAMYRNNKKGFVNTVAQNGTTYPFRNLKTLTENDDITVANLEGVLTDRKLQAMNKVFTFSGPTAYTGILKEGSVECVTLANNHSGDYGRPGTRDTEEALDQAGIARFGTENVAICEIHGVRIGFAGISITLNGNAGKRFREQIEALREAGCAAVITVMHAGTEYDLTPNVYQKRMARKAITYGSDLVIGHHPHVVQGYEVIDGAPVVYSLGNCVFGGNMHPDDFRACAVQADLIFQESTLTEIVLRFVPIMISGRTDFNDYSPVIPDGDTQEQILQMMEKSTGNPIGRENGEATVRFDMR